LFRTMDTERTRAPSIGSPRTSRSEWAYVALVVHSHGFAPHPVACHAPTQPRQRLGGRFRLSHRPLPAGYPSARDADGKGVSPRLLQPTYDTSTLRTARFPSAQPDPLPCGRGPELYRPAVRQRLPADPRVELRLTANLQLRRHHSRSAFASGFGPRAPTPPQHHAVLAEPRSKRSSARRFPAAAFSAACRACGMASDVLCRRSARSAPTFRSDPSMQSRQARFPERLVKDARFIGARTPSLDECPLPRSDSRPADGLRRRPDTPRPSLSALSLDP